MEADFNTSHVSVQEKQRVPNGCIRENFNTSHVSVQEGIISKEISLESKFQYISCISSRQVQVR